MSGITVIEQRDLSPAEFSRELEGEAFGVAASVIFVDAAPGEGPALHLHSYAELFFVLAGGRRSRTALTSVSSKRAAS